MSDKCQTASNCDLSNIREACCIHTKKVMDACRDKDCIEDLRVYLTRDSQTIVDCCTSVRARSAELLHVNIEVEPLVYNDGFFTVDITFFYRIVADAIVGGTRPGTVSGLAVFTKRCVLCGGSGSAKIFTSKTDCGKLDSKTLMHCNKPIAVVEVVDPMILAARVCDVCSSNSCECISDIPGAICECFNGDLVLSGESKRLLVTLGQFSIIRLERETQLLIPCIDYCIPMKECSASLSATTEDPCEIFCSVEFPVDEFIPGKCATATVNCIPSVSNQTGSGNSGSSGHSSCGFRTTSGC